MEIKPGTTSPLGAAAGAGVKAATSAAADAICPAVETAGRQAAACGDEVSLGSAGPSSDRSESQIRFGQSNASASRPSSSSRR